VIFMEDTRRPDNPRVSFTRVADGTRENYARLDRLEEEVAAGTIPLAATALRTGIELHPAGSAQIR